MGAAFFWLGNKLAEFLEADMDRLGIGIEIFTTVASGASKDRVAFLKIKDRLAACFRKLILVPQDLLQGLVGIEILWSGILRQGREEFGQSLLDQEGAGSFNAF